MQKINVAACDKTYSIYIAKNVLQDFGDISKTYDKYLIMSDENVWSIYKHYIKNIFPAAAEIIIKPGEKSKSFSVLQNSLNTMAQTLTRKSAIIAFGGGVVGDLAGLSASLYMRGIDFFQIPTTLLAMVDSSIGGKTAVNIPQGKNLIGTFYQPKAVFVDPVFLKTLDNSQLACGWAEIIKYAVLDKNLYDNLNNLNRADLIKKCLQIKADIVQKDEKDNSSRMALNLGHTFAHAIEKQDNYQNTHGQAVAQGLVLAAKLGEKLGATQKDLYKNISELLEKHNLPTQCKYTAQIMAENMFYDKKRENNKLTLIIPKKIGEYMFYKTDYTELLTLLERVLI